MIVGIHQPNYLPWLGYFSKISQSDIFVFLDDVPFSKGSYTNRVKVLGGGTERWLSVPVRAKLGENISAIYPAKPNWQKSHISSLANYYANATNFKTAWPRLKEILLNLPDGDLGSINRILVETISSDLSMACKFVASSDYDTGDLTGDDRLIELIRQIAPNATYISGKGANSYPNSEKFRIAGLGFSYSDFHHPYYQQMADEFSPGMSIVDLILNVGWKHAGKLISQRFRP